MAHESRKKSMLSVNNNASSGSGGKSPKDLAFNNLARWPKKKLADRKQVIATNFDVYLDAEVVVIGK